MSQGYIKEIFSSFQGEGASVEGSCYGLRQIFIRFAGCPLSQGLLGTKGCRWCDSPEAKANQPKQCLIEEKAGLQSFGGINNPVTVENILEAIRNLTTNDLHSISFTGGEPLHQPEFLEKLLILLKKENYKIYLETAYTEDIDFLKRIIHLIDFACVDVKDRSAEASLNWEMLVEREIKMCEILKNNAKVFAKTVISKSSRKEDFEVIAKLCGRIGVPIVIQIVTPPAKSNILQPTWEQIIELSGIASEYLPPDKIGISVQMHKFLDIL
ncbi:MAG: 7-carboxy-7-deazaguanine synthase QueE [Asgard group archaeon]|nr:7-carboxy-7-deazaguanine synthase QueE [Asgard group archaeon]